MSSKTLLATLETPSMHQGLLLQYSVEIDYLSSLINSTFRTVVSSSNSLTVFQRGKLFKSFHVQITRCFPPKLLRFYQISIIGCRVEENVDVPCCDVSGLSGIYKPDLESCQSFCKTNKKKYFTYLGSAVTSAGNRNKCWCKTAITTRTHFPGAYSGEAICGIGKLHGNNKLTKTNLCHAA